jgi:flagellar biosynthesis chaperone FliJ
MSLSPHQVLARLADNERTKAQEALASLGRQRQALQQRRGEVEVAMQQLVVQRDATLKVGTEASMLLMMEAAKREQQLYLLKIESEMNELYESEAALIRDWVAANQKHDSHDKMQQTLDKKVLKANDVRSQKQMDDIFAAKYVREGSAHE